MKEKIAKYSWWVIGVIGGIGLLYTVFATDQSITNGTVMGKVCWFHNAMLLFSSCFLLNILILPGGRFRFKTIDILPILVAIIVLLTYNWELNPEPDKLLFFMQLISLWFMLRYAIEQSPGLKILFIILIMGTGLIEVIWGELQLYGYATSNHFIYRLTGSFYNPGPYSGYLAIILPVCLGVILARTNTVLRYFGWVCFISILLVLPAGMSRSAWIAALFSCICVYVAYRIRWESIRILWNRYRSFFMIGGLVMFVVIFIGFIAVYYMKKDSADGRFLMWKVTTLAITKQPFTGTGLGGFPAAYAETQAAYFSTGKASPKEKMVAGCPEYAFNEYLQIGLEQGLGGLIVFIFWLASCIYQGIRNRRYGITGGIVALSLFAFSSYPLQLPSFWIILIFLAVFAVTNREKEPVENGFPYIILTAVVFSFVLFGLQIGRRDAYEKWNTAKHLYNNKVYEQAIESYEKLYSGLNHKPEYLFEYAQCLSKTERYRESNILLERAKQLSGDPMIHYIQAKNKQALGYYTDAEQELLYAIDALPERIYPYYLLTKLYAEPEFYQPHKMKAAADSVLVKEPKVHTTAIREMREEINKLLQDKGEEGLLLLNN